MLIGIRDLNLIGFQNPDKIRFLTEKLNSKQTQGIWRIIIQIPFLLQRNGGIIMNTSRFTITTVVENGYPHYKVYDNLTDNEIHCDLNELNETIWQLLGV